MSERKISYLNRTYEDYVTALKEQLSKDYPDIANDFDDASIGSWLIELVASVSDNLSYHIDRMYSETNLDSAQEKTSVYALARSNGFRVPGPKPSMVEIELSCVVSAYTDSTSVNSVNVLPEPALKYLPIVRKGTTFRANNGQYFELGYDVDFRSQFNDDGVSDREHTPISSSGGLTKYLVKKKAVAYAGLSSIHKAIIPSSKIVPFMEYTIPDTNVMCVDSIIFKIGSNFIADPYIAEFSQKSEYLDADKTIGKTDVYRFFEVNSLADQYIWGDDISNLETGNQDAPKSKTYYYGYYNIDNDGKYVTTCAVTKGEWIPLTQKFVTEFTDNGYLKVIFGPGEQVGQTTSEINGDYTKFQMSKMIRNNFLGKLPPSDATMYILYRKGGGSASNVAANTIKTISHGIYDHTCSDDFNEAVFAKVLKTMEVNNPSPSISGKDAPTVDEIKAMIKYNNAAQGRCITLKDYENRIDQIPPRYGCPFRTRAIEENNKIMIYVLGVDNNGYLIDDLPKLLLTNLTEYLSMYKAINDYIEIKPARIVNLSFEIDVYIDKNYNGSEVVSSIIDTVYDYMDINKHELGEDIYVGDIEKEIGKIDGVLNLFDLRVYNEHGTNYSSTMISQPLVDSEDAVNTTENEDQVDLDANDYILNSESDEMFQIKYKNADIRVRWKTR